MVDSLYFANISPIEGIIQSDGSWVDTLSAIAMTIIAVVNVFLTIYIYKMNRQDKTKSDVDSRKFELMMALILKSNMHRLYKFYDDVTIECRKLIDNDSQENKQNVNQSIKGSLKVFRLEFITLFNVIDPNLYRSLLNIADKLIDGITNSIFDDGINLKHEPKFDEVISQTISKNRTDFLSMIYKLPE